MSSSPLVTLVAGVAVLTVAAAQLYRVAWQRTLAGERIPTGFGTLLAPAVLAASWFVYTTPQFFWSCVIVTVFTAIYWFDDLNELSAGFRVVLCLAAGIAIGAVYVGATEWPLAVLVTVVLLTGLVNISTVNIVNFQDGADLNLATFILLTALLLAGFSSAADQWFFVASACAAYTGAFALFNARPRSLYLGDSGSFAFGAFLTVLGIAFVTNVHMPPPEAAIPAALPVIDTAFVTAKRIRIRQKFTTRHYFHLYQRLQRSYRGFGYLLPQLVNVLLCLGAAEVLQAAGVGRVLSLCLAAPAVSLVVFAVCHRLFVTGEPGPPLTRKVRI